jgi:LAO/AO transport system kinase
MPHTAATGPAPEAVPTVVDAIRAGDRRRMARAMTALENGARDAAALRAALAAHTGRAHVVGVTGPPGGGKSTLVSALIAALRARGQTVAVVAVDPSSPYTGGAVLGDRIRMGAHQADDGVFIRSLASRGHLGGLSVAAADIVDVFDAAGYDTIVVETVGAGQSEVEITRVADTRLVVCPPGLGDDVQAIKAGLLEIADAFVVSKADLPDAERTRTELHAMLALRRDRSALPPVFSTQATSGQGVAAVADWLLQRPARGTRLGGEEERRARRITRQAIAADAYGRHLGLELVASGVGWATVQMTVGPQHLNFNGGCHGGAIFSLADTALGMACNSQGEVAVLIDGHISVTVGVQAGTVLRAHAQPVTHTRKLGVYRVEITRADNGVHVANLSATVYRTGKPVSLPAGTR